LRCDSRFEGEARARGFLRIAGVDETGRGSLFGPVFAAAVILSPDQPIRGLNDSKQLDPETRERLARQIRATARAWSVAFADAGEIDRINILEASRLAMKRAVEQLSPPPDFLLVDAVSIDLPVPQRSLIKGDARCRSIAAASILAKVDRDACLREWDDKYPQYGLGENKGYSTPDHLRALAVHGPSPEHRATFEPVRRLLDPQLLLPLTVEAEDRVCR
jgi:ribonuclease HII